MDQYHCIKIQMTLIINIKNLTLEDGELDNLSNIL